MTHSIRVQTGTRDAVSREIVRQLADDMVTAVEARGRCIVALPGGSVASAVLPLLVLEDLPWSNLHVFWVDERVVPQGDPQSNAGQALALIAGSRMMADGRLHPMTNAFRDLWPSRIEAAAPAATAALQQAVEAYRADLAQVAGVPPQLDVIVLGVGEDGHVASLFPGRTAIDATQTVALEVDAPKPPPVRMTLGLDVLTRARHVIIAAFGDGKAQAMRAALEDPAVMLPVAQVLRGAHRVTVALDHGAASGLRRTRAESLG